MNSLKLKKIDKSKVIAYGDPKRTGPPDYYLVHCNDNNVFTACCHSGYDPSTKRERLFFSLAPLYRAIFLEDVFEIYEIET